MGSKKCGHLSVFLHLLGTVRRNVWRWWRNDFCPFNVGHGSAPSCCDRHFIGNGILHCRFVGKFLRGLQLDFMDYAPVCMTMVSFPHLLDRGS